MKKSRRGGYSRPIGVLASEQVIKAAKAEGERTNMPEQEAGWIADHAFEVGSGRVGRSCSVDLEVKIELAALAHIRHNHTSYDDLLNQGREREDARLEIAEGVSKVFRDWRIGPPLPA